MRAVAVLVSRLHGAISLVRGLAADRWGRLSQSLAGESLWARVKTTTGVWLGLWTFVKRTWFRALGSLLLIAVVAAACYWPVTVMQSRRVEGLASATRTWPNGRILNDATVEVQTKCSDSVLSYVVVLVPRKSEALTAVERTETAKVLTDRLRERLKAIHLVMVDKDGVPTASYNVAIDEFVRIYSSDDERLTTLEARGTLPCDPPNYLRAEALTVSWTERR